MLTAEHREREGSAEGTEWGGGAIHEAHQGSSFHSGSAAVCTRPGFRPRSRRLRWAASEYRSRELAVHLEERGPRLLPLRRRTLVDRGKEHGRSVPISAALYIVPSAFGPSSPSPIVTAGSASDRLYGCPRPTTNLCPSPDFFSLRVAPPTSSQDRELIFLPFLFLALFFSLYITAVSERRRKHLRYVC